MERRRASGYPLKAIAFAAVLLGCGNTSNTSNVPTVARPAHQPVTAVLRVANVEAASSFYEDVLDGVRRIRLVAPNGAVIHDELTVADVAIWIDRSEETPRSLGGVSGGLILETPHTEAVIGRLHQSAATQVGRNQFIDPFGHVWIVRRADRVGLVPFLVNTQDRAARLGAVATTNGLRFVAGSKQAVVELVLPSDGLRLRTPRSIGGAPFRVHLYVSDCDGTFAAALAAGHRSLSPPSAMYWGDRWALIEDADGHQWGIGQRTEELTASEIQSRLTPKPRL